MKARFIARISNILTGLAVIAVLVVVVQLVPRDVPSDIAGTARVIDGDSLRVAGHEVRLVGIDAPELDQTCQLNGEAWNCGRAARDALRGMTGGRDVACEVEGHDRFGRALARCRAGGVALNETLVAQGWAVAFGDYELEEARAARQKKGIWKSRFDRPAEHRAGRGVFGWIGQWLWPW